MKLSRMVLNTGVTIIIAIFAASARSGIEQYINLEQCVEHDQNVACIADLPNDSNSNEYNHITAAGNFKVTNSLIEVLQVQGRVVFRGRPFTKVSCLILNKPCVAYLVNTDGEWEVVALATSEQ